MSPEVIAICIQTIVIFFIGVIFYKIAKKKEMGINIQTTTYNSVLDVLTKIMVDVPLIPDESERKEKLGKLHIEVYELINKLRFVGSRQIKDWINDKVTSNFSQQAWQIWVTSESMDQLVYRIRLELGLVSLSDRFWRWVKHNSHKD